MKVYNGFFLESEFHEKMRCFIRFLTKIVVVIDVRMGLGGLCIPGMFSGGRIICSGCLFNLFKHF